MGKKSKANGQKKVDMNSASKKIQKEEKFSEHKASNGNSAKKDHTETGRKVAIIGGGLIGLGLAITLARKGVQVTVYEKRVTQRPSQGRVTNIYLSYRGITAL